MIKETKHEKFLRLAEARLPRALEEIRLVSQLSQRTYECSPAEAEEIVRHLDAAVKNVATVFSVPYSTAIGEDAEIAAMTDHLITSKNQGGPVDELDVARAIEFITLGDPNAAKGLLKAALKKQKR